MLGIRESWFRYAFSGSSFAYGLGYFNILSIFTYPSFVAQNEAAFSASMVLCNLFAYLLILVQGLCISFNQPSKILSENQRLFFLTGFVAILLSLPGANFLLVNLHPELWQSVFFIYSASYFIKYCSTYSFKILLLSALAFGLALGIKISLFPLLLVYFLCFIYIHKSDWKSSTTLHLIAYSAVLIFSSLLSINPLFFITPLKTFNFFLDEFHNFSGSLNFFAIADWNYYTPLKNRGEVIVNWLTYPYIKSLIGLPLSIILIVVAGV